MTVAAVVATVWVALALPVAVLLGRAIRLGDDQRPNLRLISGEAPTSPPTACSGEEGRRRGHIALVS